MLRISLKTSDKAEAKRRAAALELELEMIAVKFPRQEGRPNPGQLRAVFKEALEYKRDQIAYHQIRPPFDDDRHRLANRSYGKLYSLIAQTNNGGSSKPWEAALADPQLDDEEREFLRYLFQYHAHVPTSEDAWREIQNSFLSSGLSGDDERFTAPNGRPAIAPRFIARLMDNANIEANPENTQTVQAVMAAAYRAAFVEANTALGEADAEANCGPSPLTLLALLGGSPTAAFGKNNSPPSKAPIDEAEVPGDLIKPGPVAGPLPVARSVDQAEPGGLVDLRMSELSALAIQENKRAGDWSESAQRNAKVIADIFAAENGDLLMSEIERRHLIALDNRLKIMPTIWGKNREDRGGGLEAVFARGEQLAAAWNKDHRKAAEDGIAKVGLSPATYNRHINTLKQLFHFVRNLEDADGKPTHVYPNVSFHKLRQKDKRKKNKRKPVPHIQELRALVSGPIFTGCKGPNARFLPGKQVIHDGAYWMPLLLVIYGPRSNEFCQMPLANVVDRAPVPYFRIRQTLDQNIKTVATDRDLPIGRKLRELGFLDYVKALRDRKEHWLFPEYNQTRAPARKVFRDRLFLPLLQHHFPEGTSNILDGKDIDTQSLRKFAPTYLRKGLPKIELGLRQAYLGHERPTTTEGTYEDDPTAEELLPCAEKMETLLDHLTSWPLNLQFE